MQFGFFFNQSRCSGCFTCVIACKQWHSVGREVMSWRRVDTIESGTFPELKTSFLSLSCLHCQTPCCISVCPTSAILKREEDGVVIVDSEKCLGQPHCGVCKDACPYRIPQFNPDHDLKMEKCDFCLDRMEQGKRPVCVDACPMRALDAAPLTELSRTYGNEKVVDGFHFSEKATPSIVLKRKR
jgi:anaerobic dimethyl sulfoxide reductase subunit B (iron-sulfur subunit)